MLLRTSRSRSPSARDRRRSRSRSRSSSSTSTPRDSLRNGIIASASAVAIAALLALGARRRVHRPADPRLAEKARRVGTGDLSGPLHLAQRDELGELANEINLMCERLAAERSAREQATEQLRHADRLTTVGKLASGLAHELGTPLNVVQRPREADPRWRGRGRRGDRTRRGSSSSRPSA